MQMHHALLLSVELPRPQCWQAFEVWFTPLTTPAQLVVRKCQTPRSRVRYGPWIYVNYRGLWACLRSWNPLTSMHTSHRSSWSSAKTSHAHSEQSKMR